MVIYMVYISRSSQGFSEHLRWFAGFLPSTVSTAVTFCLEFPLAISQAVYLRLRLALPMSLAIKVLPRQLSFFCKVGLAS